MTTATALKPSVPKQPPSPNTTGRVIAAAKSAYQYPLIIKHLWHAPLLQARDQEASLAGVGVRPGDTVRVLDWDSNRFSRHSLRRRYWERCCRRSAEQIPT